MGLYHEYEDKASFNDLSYDYEDDIQQLSHKKLIRKMLEEKLERKRLKEEIDELDGDFDWDDSNND